MAPSRRYGAERKIRVSVVRFRAWAPIIRGGTLRECRPELFFPSADFHFGFVIFSPLLYTGCARGHRVRRGPPRSETAADGPERSRACEARWRGGENPRVRGTTRPPSNEFQPAPPELLNNRVVPGGGLGGYCLCWEVEWVSVSGGGGRRPPTGG